MRRKYFANISCIYFKLVIAVFIHKCPHQLCNKRETDVIKNLKQFHFISIIIVHIKLRKFAGILLLVIRIQAAENCTLNEAENKHQGVFSEFVLFFGKPLMTNTHNLLMRSDSLSMWCVRRLTKTLVHSRTHTIHEIYTFTIDTTQLYFAFIFIFLMSIVHYTHMKSSQIAQL